MQEFPTASILGGIETTAIKVISISHLDRLDIGFLQVNLSRILTSRQLEVFELNTKNVRLGSESRALMASRIPDHVDSMKICARTMPADDITALEISGLTVRLLDSSNDFPLQATYSSQRFLKRIRLEQRCRGAQSTSVTTIPFGGEVQKFSLGSYARALQQYSTLNPRFVSEFCGL